MIVAGPLTRDPRLGHRYLIYLLRPYPALLASCAALQRPPFPGLPRQT